eukprot:GHVH01004335.1.p1 GENE.GHVH01004335.1~~GHVH01004335.1.p1  ORF type:complete len:385 (-),score=58.81 GHVH01004335.1:108-1262(-)
MSHRVGRRAPIDTVIDILTMRPYNEKTDMWSMGVIIYMMLSGRPPFSAGTDFETLALIKKAKLVFPEAKWSQTSDLARDFLGKLLVKNPARRMSAQEAIMHPWITKAMDCENDLDFGSTDLRTIVGHIKDFTERTHAFRSAWNYLAKRASNSLITDIEAEFNRFDTSNTGVIELADWLEVMDHVGVERNEALDLFESIDVNDDGVIRYSSFVASVHRIRGDIDNEDFMRASFQKLSCDYTRIDYLIESDLISRFGDETGRDIFREIANVKSNDQIDHGITFSQFRKFLMTGGIMKSTQPDDSLSESSLEEDSVDLELVKGKERCWEQVAHLTCSASKTTNNVPSINDPVSVDPVTASSTKTLLAPEGQEVGIVNTFHLARGISL